MGGMNDEIGAKCPRVDIEGVAYGGSGGRVIMGMCGASEARRVVCAEVGAVLYKQGK